MKSADHLFAARSAFASSIALAAALCAGDVLAQCIRPNDCMPPPGGCAYPAPGAVFYPGSPGPRGFRKLTLYGPSHCDPAPAGTISSFFDVFVEIELTTNGGGTWTPTAPTGHCGIRMIHILPDPAPGVRLFDTEMLQMELIGGTMPPNTIIRESPTLASPGQTQITDLGGGQFRIDSFFDVFTELSLDNGQTWTPSDQAARLVLGPIDPTPARGSTWGAVKLIYR